jgi:hypothetical protein
MNDRIQDLAYDAEDYAAAVVDERSWPVDGGSGFHPIFVKKFAELIVRECIQSIKNTIQTTCDTDSEKMGCEFAITDLIQHFGVEK